MKSDFELRNITKTFGSVTANNEVSIKIEKGTIHAIVGENGAGKSTIMRIAYGFYTADSGDILVDRKTVQIRNPHDAIALGIGMVHQHFMLVDAMTVAENVILGAETESAINLDLEKVKREIAELSEKLRLDIEPDALIENLPLGSQQKVELLKALYRNAELLILDEPTAVLTPQEVEDFFNILRRMRASGKTIVIITHKLEEVLAISDNVMVMRDGRVVGNVKTRDTNQKDLARMIVGRDVLLRVEKTDAYPGDVILNVTNLSAQSARGEVLKNVSFNVRQGEIVGIAGVEGNGQTELMEGLAGLANHLSVSGTIDYLNVDITGITTKNRRAAGIAHIPEDRHRRGLLLDFDLAANSILGVHYHPPVSRLGILNKSVIENQVGRIIKDYDIRPPHSEVPARTLSGGNQQKLIIGREIGTYDERGRPTPPPRLLLVSQPTRGVDIGAIEFIHQRLIDLRDSGTAILLVSSELEEVITLADRLLVIKKGKIVGEVDPKVTSVENVGLLMTGSKQRF